MIMLSPTSFILFYIYFLITLPLPFIVFYIYYLFFVIYHLVGWASFLTFCLFSVLTVQANLSLPRLFSFSCFCVLPKSLLQMCMVETSKTRSILLDNPVSLWYPEPSGHVAGVRRWGLKVRIEAARGVSFM